MLSAIILAAGESRRFGDIKPLHKIKGKSFVEIILDVLEELDAVSEIMLGLGYNHKVIARSLGAGYSKMKIVINPDPARGQLSTLQECLKYCSSCKGFLVSLVDHPFVRKGTYIKMIDQFIRSGSKNIIIPVCKKKKGHPVIFPEDLKDALLRAPLDQGARWVVQQFTSRVEYVNVRDRFILADIDRKQDLETLAGAV
ncbi:MAG: nucleotidyltransferase family protein [Spirochaetes bacterium]|nr:nucleotidyltransferase family protein [Spirochaetota bacterium]